MDEKQDDEALQNPDETADDGTDLNQHTCSYPNETTLCSTEDCMYPVLQTHPENRETMVVDDWLSDAPMPYDARFGNVLRSDCSKADFNGPTSSNYGYHPMDANRQQQWGSSDPSPPPFHPGHERPPLLPVNSDEDNKHDSPSSSEPSPSNMKLSDITTLEQLDLNCSETSPQKPIEDTSIVEVHMEELRDLSNEVRELDESKPWCSVFYYELGIRVGNPFFGHELTFTIDGATGKTDEHRLSLSAQPPAKVPKCGFVRNQIGDGLRVTYSASGCVYLTVLSEQAAFIQCPFRNQMEGESASAIVRLQNKKAVKDENQEWVSQEPPSLKLFDRARFDAEKSAMNDMSAEEALRVMQSFCTTRISFIKGFGEEYSRRSITDCPCWVEIHLNEPYDAFDEFLRSHDSEPFEMASRS